MVRTKVECAASTDYEACRTSLEVFWKPCAPPLTLSFSNSLEGLCALLRLGGVGNGWVAAEGSCNCREHYSRSGGGIAHAVGGLCLDRSKSYVV